MPEQPSTVPDAVVEVEPGGVIVRADARAEQLFGRPAGDLAGMRVGELVADRLAEPGPRPPGVDLVLIARRADGTTFPAEVRVGTVTGASHGHRVALAIRDVSPPSGAAAAPGAGPQRGARASAGGRNELSTVAHDLNNVLSVMLIYSELIERAVQGRSMDEYLGEIRAAAERGAELTDRLRTLARRSATDATASADAPHPRADEELLLEAVRQHAVVDAAPGSVGVGVVDDHRMFAEGLSRLLDVEDDIEVLGVGGTGREAVALVEQLSPRVLLLDFDMPGGNGVIAATEIKQRWPATMIVMISGSTDERLLLRAIDAGCSGYLTKDRAAADVAKAVRVVAAGEPLISPAQMARLLPRLSRSERGVGADLTGRELEVLRLLARGATNTTIVAALSSNPDTVRDDVDAVLRKLGAHSKLEAVATGIREGLIDYNSPF